LAAGPLAALSIGLGAQEGYPLDGTWRGNWGTEPNARNHVVIVMKWDGETINGRINPGPNAIDFASATLDPSDWTVHIEADPADGEPIVIEGTLEDIGSYNRAIEGTWTAGGQTHAFRIARE
jgi:hypothetical protein